MERATTVLLIISAMAGTAFGNVVENPSFEDPVLVGTLPQDFGFWRGDVSACVVAQDGIVPQDGVQMLQFIATTEVGADGRTSGSEQWQLVDMRPFDDLLQTGDAMAIGAFSCNRVQGDAETDTQFAVTLRTYAGSPSTFPSQWSNQTHLSRASSTIISDSDVETWEQVDVSVCVPPEADFLAIRVLAGENVVNDAGAPEFDGHYADTVDVQIVLSECPADLNCGRSVEFADILAILGTWGNAGGREDLDGSGRVDFGDLLVVLGSWGPCS